MKLKKGFTLIELVIVIVIIAILSAVALPKFLNLSKDAKLATMQGMQAALSSARDLTFFEIEVSPERLSDFTNNAGRVTSQEFTLDNGQTIRVRGGYPDGRWANTFAHLVDISSILATNTSTDLCQGDTDWCARQKGAGWFIGQYSQLTRPGRGFLIYPNGFDVADGCAVYYYTPNSASTTTPVTPIVAIDDSGC